mgnify:CR=1 FL=1
MLSFGSFDVIEAAEGNFIIARGGGRGFEHPTTGEPMAFADNLPRDLQEALDSLAARSLGKTEAGREVAELMATSPVPSVEGEVPDE